MSRTSKKNHIVWKNFPGKFRLVGKNYLFNPIHSNQIAAVIALLKHAFPDMRSSYQGCYLRKEFYQKEVALLDHWSRHAKTRRFLLYVATQEHSKQIAGVASIFRESDLPTVVSGVGAVDQSLRESGLFEKMVHHLVRVGKKSGVEHAICIATVENPASQRVYLKEGFSVCGIVPGEDRRIVRSRKTQFVADIYFYKFLNGAGSHQLPESHWKLLPEVRPLWQTIKRLKKS